MFTGPSDNRTATASQPTHSQVLAYLGTVRELLTEPAGDERKQRMRRSRRMRKTQTLRRGGHVLNSHC